MFFDFSGSVQQIQHENYLLDWGFKHNVNIKEVCEYLKLKSTSSVTHRTGCSWLDMITAGASWAVQISLLCDGVLLCF